MSDEVDLIARLRNIVGSNAVATGDATHNFIVDDLRPQYVLFPANVRQLSRCLSAADAADLTVIPVGNGTQLGIGRVPQRYDVALSTQKLRRIVAHEAADMTVTVEAGVTLADLNAALALAGQRLPLDPPHPERTTIGALIATDACGPLRLSQGKVRDLLIGITVVLADGTPVKGGGRVVKNVAGYDLMKLFTGSFGTLGVIVEATFKVRPRPEREAVFVIPAGSIDAAVGRGLDVLAAPVAPAFVEALNRSAMQSVGGDGAAVVIGCEGSAQEIDVQRERLVALAGRESLRVLNDADGARLSAALRDFQGEANGVGPAVPAESTISPLSQPKAAGTAGPTSVGLRCKVSVVSSRLAALLRGIEDEAEHGGVDTAMLAHVGSGVGVIRFTGAADEAVRGFAERLRALVRKSGGWVTFDALPVALKRHIDPWDADVPGLALMRGIKQTLDPKCRLSPGRFVGGI
ncbi:MAG: FAD-binding oxidoreductase [Candidatus Binatia bacterium]